MMRTSSISPFVLTALILPLLPIGLAAQQAPAADQPTSHKPAAAHDVILAVTVKDKHGNLVPNLTAADFTLTEDGRPQNIKTIGQQSEMPLLVGLEVDTSRTVEGAMSAERTAAQKFVQTVLPADPKEAKSNDQAFLIHFDNEVELLEDFTNSRDKLNRELDQMGPTSRGHSNPSGPETRDDGGPYGRPGGQGGSQGGGQTGSRPSYGGTQLYDAIYLASDELMKPKVGRKALIVFSDGVDRSSKETQSEAIDSAERADTVVYSVYFRGGEERENNTGGMQRGGGYPGGGGGYPGGGGGGYPGGGYPGGGYPGQRRGGGDEKASVDGKKVMQDLATRTGGQFFEAKKSDNLADIYNQIATDLHGQYVLVYTPDKSDDEGGYHKVLLKAKKDDLIVTTREGYYAPGGEER